MIQFKTTGNFKNINGYLERIKELKYEGILNKYGEEGVILLAANTPKKTGRTATSWQYTIERENNKASLIFYNDNVKNGVNIAILLQYGHGTKNGNYVQGIDYINPTIKPLFEKLAKELWEEVTKI